MKGAPLKIEIVGRLPVFYRACTKCQPLDYLQLSGADYISKQLAGYPPEVVAEQNRIYDLYERLVRDFSGAALLVPIELLSPRGLWLSFRYRLGKEPAVVIGGKRVLSADRPYEEIKRTVERQLTKSDYTEGGNKNGEPGGN